MAASETLLKPCVRLAVARRASNRASVTVWGHSHPRHEVPSQVDPSGPSLSSVLIAPLYGRLTVFTSVVKFGDKAREVDKTTDC
jgi:hypothetical protein